MNRKKKIGKTWRDRSGVSPIVGVILIIAISMVLGAAIYAWYSEFVEVEEVPNISCWVIDENNELVVFSADEGIRWTDISIRANRSCNGSIYTYTSGWASENATDSINTTFEAIGTDIWTYIDSTGEIGFGDTITLSGVTGKVEITLRYDPEDEELGTWVVDV